MLKTVKSTSNPDSGNGQDTAAAKAGHDTDAAERASDVTPLFAAAAGRNAAAAPFPVEETVRSEIQRVRLDLLARETERLQQRLQQVLDERRQDRAVIDELRQQIEQVTQKGLLMAARTQSDGASDDAAAAELDGKIKPLLQTLLRMMERTKQAPGAQGSVGSDSAAKAPAPDAKSEPPSTSPRSGPSAPAKPAPPKPAPAVTTEPGQPAQPADPVKPADPASSDDAWAQIDASRDAEQAVATSQAAEAPVPSAADRDSATAAQEAAPPTDPFDMVSSPGADGESRLAAPLPTSIEDDDEEGVSRDDPGFIEVARLLRQPDPRTEARARRTEGIKARELRHGSVPPEQRPAAQPKTQAPAAEMVSPAKPVPEAKAKSADKIQAPTETQGPAKPARAKLPEAPEPLLLGGADTPRVDQPATPPVDQAATPRVDQPATPRVDQPATPRVDQPATPRVDQSTSKATAPTAAGPIRTVERQAPLGSILRARRTAPRPLRADGLKGREDVVARRLAAVVDRATAASGSEPQRAKAAEEASPTPPQAKSTDGEAVKAEATKPEAAVMPRRPLAQSHDAKAEAPQAKPVRSVAAASEPASGTEPRRDLADKVAEPASPQAPLAPAAQGKTTKPVSSSAETAARPTGPMPEKPESAKPDRLLEGLTSAKDANPIRAALPKCLTEPWDDEESSEGFLSGNGGRSGSLRWPFRRARSGKAADGSEPAPGAPAGKRSDEPKEG